ncbi:MAG: hypothetical protein V1743_04000 [Nanoarchaeota archaeon]
MKLAILAPEFVPTWGGVGIYTVELVRELAKFPELEIHVITPRRGEGYDPRDISLTQLFRILTSIRIQVAQ